MVQVKALLLASALTVFVSAQGTGTQFITGPCTSDATCASGCCGFNTGKCAGAIVALERDGGCGFGSGTPNDNAARQLGFTGTFNPGTGNGNANTAAAGNNGSANANANGGGRSGASRNGNGNGNTNAGSGNTNTGAAAGGNGAATARGSQFITGVCSSDADCASGCCGFNSGKCAGPVIAQERDGGCGFGNGTPNDNAAVAFREGQKRGLEYEWE